MVPFEGAWSHAKGRIWAMNLFHNVIFMHTLAMLEGTSNPSLHCIHHLDYGLDLIIPRFPFMKLPQELNEL